MHDKLNNTSGASSRSSASSTSSKSGMSDVSSKGINSLESSQSLSHCSDRLHKDLLSEGKLLQNTLFNFPFPDLTFSEFFINLHLDEDSPFLKESFLGAALRGAVMNRAKYLLCANKKSFNDCSKCILVQKCIYAQLFETKQRANAEIMKKYREIPHPFIMTPLLKQNGSSNLSVRIVLFGEFIEYFPYFYFVFKSMEERKKYKVLSVQNFDRNILNGDKLITPFARRSSIDFIGKANGNIMPENSEVEVAFLTPLRIKKNGKLVNPTTFDFQSFLTNVLRRITLLSYFYGKEWGVSGKDVRNIISLASSVRIVKNELGWLELERYSSRSKTFMPMGGIVGKVVLSKEASKFIPFLRLGQYTQVGKNTSFGHGYYTIKLIL